VEQRGARLNKIGFGKFGKVGRKGATPYSYIYDNFFL